MLTGKNESKHVLISALDWGLGHATRTSEIIDRLLSLNYKVTLIGSGRGYYYFKQRYPDMKIYKVFNLTLRYSRSSKTFHLKITWVFLKMFINILLDRLFLPKILKETKPDLIISDSRFGIRSKKVYSIIISHLINFHLPKSVQFLDTTIFWNVCRLINKYNEHWIPDYALEPNLSGKLSHFRLCHPNTYYIGLLSRFKHYNCQPNYEYDIFCIVSGIEPQRTIFVQKIINTFKNTDWKVIIASGAPEKNFEQNYNNITLVSYMDGEKFCQYTKGAKYIIVRAGYSTLMDLVALGRTALIVPTPRQTEQEYIAWHLNSQKIFQKISQKQFSLQSFLKFTQQAPILQKNLDNLRKIYNL